MSSMFKVLLSGCLILNIILSACQVDGQPSASQAAEASVQIIPLAGPIAARKAEISGMTWYGDYLILLPQFPHRVGNAIYAIARQDILYFLSGEENKPITPIPISIDTLDLKKRLPGYEGFESIAFSGNRVFFTVETHQRFSMLGYLVLGTISPDMQRINLQYELKPIPPQAHLDNYSDEAILVYQDQILTFYEANGAQVNPAPIGHRFNLSGLPLDSIPFPNIEYRITDATQPDKNGIFWAINVFFPIEEIKLNPAPDLLALTYGQGPTHAQSRNVERLVAFRIEAQRVILVDQPPIQLAIESSMITRNWEALETLNQRGFLIASDKFPQTLFGFVPFPALPQP